MLNLCWHVKQPLAFPRTNLGSQRIVVKCTFRHLFYLLYYGGLYFTSSRFSWSPLHILPLNFSIYLVLLYFLYLFFTWSRINNVLFNIKKNTVNIHRWDRQYLQKEKYERGRTHKENKNRTPKAGQNRNQLYNLKKKSFLVSQYLIVLSSISFCSNRWKEPIIRL